MTIVSPVGIERQQQRLALALGPGGTRGFAHLGVIKVLLEAGLQIDAICGASAGALFGAIYAIDGTPHAVVHGMSVSAREIWGLFRDRLRLASSNRLGARLAEFYGGARLESLPVPFCVLAVDLDTGEEVLLREGPVRDAVEASIAIPLVARPVALGGRYLIDGGYGRRGPSVPARTMGAEVVVSVSLGEFGLCPPRLRSLAQRVAHRLQRPGRRGPPDQRAVLRRAILAMAAGYYEAPDADLVIEPRMEDINPNSPFAAAESFWRGERATRRALPTLRRLLAGPAPASE